MEIHQCNPLYKQTQGKKHMIISFHAQEAFEKMKQLLMAKVLEKSEIQSPYLNIVKAKYSKFILNNQRPRI